MLKLYDARHANYSGAGRGDITFQVLPGDNADLVAPRLVKDGVIRATAPFIAAAKDSTSLVGLEPGYFRLHLHMNAALAYKLLISPAARIQSTVTIPEGLRAVNIVRTLGAKSAIPQSAFSQALKDTAALGLPSYAGGKPEGYLFPATYTITPHESALTVLQAMVGRFKTEAASVQLPAAAKHAEFTQAQVIVVASLIQAEGGRLSDFPKISRVIDNRLIHGMPLQLDSTVLYALNSYGIQASFQQTRVNSPYNTYLHTGLPPGPIDSPGDAAIRAALHPVHGSWLYFVTVNPKTGLTKYATSYAQFKQLEAELRAYEAGSGG